MKKWYQSKTIWFNTAAASLVVLEQHLPMLKAVIPIDVYSVLAVAVPVVNVWLRAITTKGIQK